MTDRLPHRQRRDAADNRDRILDAAREVFTTDGMRAPLSTVARRAGVGAATLYRHFPTKQALVDEAFVDQLRACRRIIDEGLADADPARGLRQVIERVCELHARRDDATGQILSALPDSVLHADRDHALASAAELIRRAKAADALRPDVGLTDLALLLSANRGLRATSPAARVAASRRYATLVVRALQVPTPDA